MLHPPVVGPGNISRGAELTIIKKKKSCACEGSNTYFFRFTSLSIFRGSKSFNICNKGLRILFFFNIHQV